MKDVKSLVEDLPAYDITGWKAMYKVVDLQQAVYSRKEKGYIDKCGIMLTPFYISDGKHLELMPYDFIVDVVAVANIGGLESRAEQEDYWEEVKRITHKRIARENPIVRETDILGWTNLLLTSLEIRDTIDKTFEEPFNPDNVFFEAYLNF